MIHLKPAAAVFSLSKTIRLAGSYLVIIMVLCITFSVLFYYSSAGGLNASGTRTQTSSNEHAAGATIAPDDMFSGTNGRNAASHPVPTPDNAAAANLKLQASIHEIRINLAHRLVLLNVSVLVCGSVLSYVLARRTLQPIELALEAQGRFASEASHELRTPLTVMQSENEGALRLLDTSNPARAVIKSNLEEIAALKELSESLLRIANESKTLPLQPLWIDDVTNQAKKRLAKAAKLKTIRIRDSSRHVRVIGNQSSLIEVMVILLDNAITYSPTGALVYIDGHIDGKQANIYVRDEGIGINKADLPHIFDRFYRASNASEQHPSGHGLGLSIAQHLVAQQHGTIQVNSTFGSGTTFTITLPIDRAT